MTESRVATGERVSRAWYAPRSSFLVLDRRWYNQYGTGGFECRRTPKERHIKRTCLVAAFPAPGLCEIQTTPPATAHRDAATNRLVSTRRFGETAEIGLPDVAIDMPGPEVNDLHVLLDDGSPAQACIQGCP